MGRPRKTPAEFPSDWHYENHLENLAREIQGYKDQVEYLKALEGPEEDKAQAIANAEGGLAAAQAELKHYSGPKNASKRPKAEEKETR